MGLWNSIWGGIKTLGKAALSMFDPFKNDEYRSAPREEQDRFQQEIEIIANDKTLDHEYRMEAQRVLAKIESYRHAEEMARIEGTTTITVAQIEGTKAIVIAKLDLYKESLIRSSKKELALIDAMGKNTELIGLFIERLDTVSVEVKELIDKVDLYSNEVINLNNLSKASSISTEVSSREIKALGEKITNLPKSPSILIEINSNNDSLEWADNLWLWEKNQGINILPKDLKSLVGLTTLNLSSNGLTELPIEIGNLTNLTTLNLSYNKLTELPREIGNLTNLIKLILFDNKLTELPAEIGNLTNLKTLFLFGNELTINAKSLLGSMKIEYLYTA